VCVVVVVVVVVGGCNFMLHNNGCEIIVFQNIGMFKCFQFFVIYKCHSFIPPKLFFVFILTVFLISEMNDQITNQFFSAKIEHFFNFWCAYERDKGDKFEISSVLCWV
jgi:hypothetical protein